MLTLQGKVIKDPRVLGQLQDSFIFALSIADKIVGSGSHNGSLVRLEQQFSDGCFLAYGWSGCLDEWKDIIEVIGNIYENPDLLFVLNTEEK